MQEKFSKGKSNWLVCVCVCVCVCLCVPSSSTVIRRFAVVSSLIAVACDL